MTHPNDKRGDHLLFDKEDGEFYRRVWDPDEWKRVRICCGQQRPLYPEGEICPRCGSEMKVYRVLTRTAREFYVSVEPLPHGYALYKKVEKNRFSCDEVHTDMDAPFREFLWVDAYGTPLWH